VAAPAPRWWSSPGTVSVVEEHVSSACSRTGALCGLASAPLQGLLIVAYLPVQELSVPKKMDSDGCLVGLCFQVRAHGHHVTCAEVGQQNLCAASKYP